MCVGGGRGRGDYIRYIMYIGMYIWRHSGEVSEGVKEDVYMYIGWIHQARKAEGGVVHEYVNREYLGTRTGQPEVLIRCQ